MVSCLLLIAGIFGSQHANAIDYVVTGANTLTNGDLNPDPITGVGNTLTLTNGSSITATNAEGIHFDTAGQNTIVNLGSISTTGSFAYGIFNEDSADSTINNSGSISTTGNSGFGINNDNSAGGTITNSGSISTTGGSAFGINNDNSAGSTITNSRSISTTGGSASGIYNTDSAGSTITNSRSISTMGGSAFGIYNGNSADSTINNSGSISTMGGSAFGIYNTDSADSTINNSGSISTMGGSAFGIYNTDSADSTINNSGSIRVEDSTAIGIRSTDAVTVANSGLVFASATTSNAFELSTGNDNLTLSAGSRIQGLIDLNNGDDTVTLNHGGNDIAWRWTFENFKDASPDVLSVIGAPYVVQDAGLSSGGLGITVTVADLSREANAGAVLADLTGAVRGAVTGRISEAWALADAGLGTGMGMADDTGTPLGWNAWAKAFGGHQDRGSLAEFGGLSTDTRHSYGGVIVGADNAPSDGALFGAFGGFALSRLSFADASLNDTGAPDIDTNTLFGGIYGRIASAHNQTGGSFFADGTLSVGYADGDADTRLQANNLVMGGIEEITGGDASGAYIATSATFGAHVPVGTTSAVLIPSATLGYAAQWRKGYSEDMSVDGAMSVEDYVAAVLTARLQLATRISRSTGSDTGSGSSSGMAWTAAFRGGIDVQKDVSQDIELTMLNTALSANAGPDDVQLGGFLGTNLAMMLSDTLALTIDGELTFAGHNADELGGTVNAGIRARF